MAIWKILQKRWKHRCEIVHDHKNPKTWEKQALLLQIKNLHSHGKILSDEEQCMFNVPESSWKTKTTKGIKSWIQKHKPLMQMAVRAAKKRQKLNTPDIRKHLIKIMKRRQIKNKTPTKSEKPKTTKKMRQSALHKMPGFTTHKQTDHQTNTETPWAHTSKEFSPDRTNHRKMHDHTSINFDLWGGSANLT